MLECHMTENSSTSSEYSRSTGFRTFVLTLAFVILAGGIGYSLGKRDLEESTSPTNGKPSLVNIDTPKDTTVSFDMFWQVWKLLELSYIDKSKIDSQKMVWGAIKGMTQSLGDPYTVFLPPEENTATRQTLDGAFEGIGAQLGMKDGRIVVIAPLKGMPADKAGLLPGDVIVQVDGLDTAGWSVPEAVEKIRGQRGSSVKLAILHPEETTLVDITVVRERIEIPVVEVSFRDNVAVVRLNQFVETMPHQWEEAMRSIATTCQTGASSCDGVILDLRNNPGGFLQGSVYISSEFLSDGTVVIQEFANGNRETYAVDRKGTLLTTPLVVLVNEGSASASEIVAGALKVHKRATIVGTKTFGKGTIQERKELPEGAGLHITTAKWLLPDDSWINEKGIEPDVLVEDVPETETVDEQLDTAVSTVKSL